MQKQLFLELKKKFFEFMTVNEGAEGMVNKVKFQNVIFGYARD